MKKTSDGITIQKTDQENWLIATVSFVSRYIQTIASREVSGREASIAPAVLNRFPTSEMPVTRSAVKMILIRILIMLLCESTCPLYFSGGYYFSFSFK